MIFSIVLFVLSWICFSFFADKQRFFSLAPTCYIAMYLACTTDLLVHHYPLWDYPAPNKMQTYWRHLLHDLGIYPVVTYLFLQTLPIRQNTLTLVRHIFHWSLFAIFIEWLAIKAGVMKHQLWWNFGYSYASDWLLYLIFYSHHKWREKHTKQKTDY